MGKKGSSLVSLGVGPGNEARRGMDPGEVFVRSELLSCSGKLLLLLLIDYYNT